MILLQQNKDITIWPLQINVLKIDFIHEMKTSVIDSL